MRYLLRAFLPSVFCFIITSSFFVFMSARLEMQRHSLLTKICVLESARNDALELNDDLKSARASQSDPEFLELLLMKKLGVVPEGFKKVIFVSREDS